LNIGVDKTKNKGMHNMYLYLFKELGYVDFHKTHCTKSLHKIFNKCSLWMESGGRWMNLIQYKWKVNEHNHWTLIKLFYLL
jgi:hypothetical protein